MIQIALKGLPGGGKCRKKTMSDLALPLYVVDELKKRSYVGTPTNYGKKIYQVNILLSFNKSILPLQTADSELPHCLMLIM
jgi:hypothetical protein